jgi:WD40 repeat protein
VSVLAGWSGEEVSCLDLSPDGRLLAAGGAAGTVRVWRLGASPSEGGGLPAVEDGVELPSSAASGGAGAVRWLPAPGGGGWVLLVGDASCSALQLWGGGGAAADSWRLLQEVRLEGREERGPLWCHVEALPAQQLVVLADTARKAVYTLHYTGERPWPYTARVAACLHAVAF